LPNAPQSSRSLYVIPKRPHLRDAVDLSSITYGGRLTAKGEMIHEEVGSGIDGNVGLGWIRLGIRNREWDGKQVAREIVNCGKARELSTGILDVPRPPYPENEALDHWRNALQRW
jgi:hypothetical protein